MIEFHQRLRDARIAAGYESAQDAVARFGWTYATYAGHENGSRGAKPQAISAYARAFKTTEQWLTYGTGPRTPKRAESKELATAFQEPPIVPFKGANASDTTSITNHLVAIHGNMSHATVYKTNTAFPSISVSQGDLLLVELNGHIEDGDIVVCTSVDVDTGDAETTLLRVAGLVMVGEINQKPVYRDDERFAILGTVSAVLSLKR